MSKRDKQPKLRFRPGSTGGCEALLYEFKDWTRKGELAEDLEPSPAGHGFELVRIAASDFNGACELLRRSHPDFRVGSVRCFGLIEMHSGTPLS